MAGWKRWAALGAAVVAAGSLVAVRWSSAPPPRADAAVIALSPFAVPGRGADVPFTEQEAENAATNGTILLSDRRHGTLQSEASGRRAVTLDAVGEYVEFSPSPSPRTRCRSATASRTATTRPPWTWWSATRSPRSR